MNNNPTPPIYSLLYTRVSSKSQKSEGSGDASQEVRCLEYSNLKGYIYEKTFEDIFTGGGNFMNRKGMVQLLQHIDENKQKRYVVIFDDLKRFARDVKFHIQLREALDKRNVKVESPNFTFDDSPEGEAHELYTAVSNQLERKQNQRQVIQKQTARLVDGYWPFHAPIGYTMRKVEGYGKILFPNEKAEIIKEALEGFATFKFLKRIDVAQFLKEKGIFGNQLADKYIETVTSLLNNILYAGYIEYAKRGITRRKGRHEGIITIETFDLIQKRLKKSEGARIRRDIRDDFPIRGLVNCALCKNKMTAAFVTNGRHRKEYGYYHCCKPGCPLRSKTVLKKIIEKQFDELLVEKDFNDEIIELAGAVYNDAWGTEIENRDDKRSKMEEEIKDLENEIDGLSELAYQTKIQVVRSQYERRIERLAARIEELQNEIDKKPVVYQVSFQTCYDKVGQLLKSPYTVWQSWSALEKQKLFLFF
ncbi:MAG TPA: recombinase family protein, partial [Cytophagales bacterium]|nr:recombinase family protein [Cytophagales bacterium]